MPRKKTPPPGDTARRREPEDDAGDGTVENHETDGHPQRGEQDYPPPPVALNPEEHIYNADQPPDLKFQELGRRLNEFGDLFRHPDHGAGLKLIVRGGKPRAVPVETNNDLLAVINDRLRTTVVADGKPKGGRIPAAELGSMIRSEIFLQRFRPLDRVIEEPLYLSSWEPAAPGYNDDGWGRRYFYPGGDVESYPEPDTIRLFLSVVPFASPADRTNAVAAALTVLLRNH